MKVAPFICLAASTCALLACHRTLDPADTIGAAYNWYVEKLKKDENPLRSPELQRFTTARFLESIENVRSEIDQSPFADAQAFDANIAIQDVKIQGSSATARVTLAGRMVGRHVLNVFLIREEKAWRIDDVKLASESE